MAAARLPSKPPRRPGAGAALAAGILVLALALVAFVDARNQRAALSLREAADLPIGPLILAQRTARYADLAARGDAEGFTALERALASFLDTLARDGPAWRRVLGGAEGPGTSEGEGGWGRLLGLWRNHERWARVVLTGRESVIRLSETVPELEATLRDAQSRSDELVSVMVDTGASSSQIYTAARQLMLYQRLRYNLREAIGGGSDQALAATRVRRDAALFEQVLQGLLNGDRALGIVSVADSEARKLLEALIQAMPDRRQLVSRVLGDVEALKAIREAARAIQASNRALQDALPDMIDRARRRAEMPANDGVLVPLLLASALLMLLLLLGIMRRDSSRWRAREEIAERQARGAGEREQEAAMWLARDLTRLAEGDLTVTAGADVGVLEPIADATNDLARRLRERVGTARLIAARLARDAGRLHEGVRPDVEEGRRGSAGPRGGDTASASPSEPMGSAYRPAHMAAGAVAGAMDATARTIGALESLNAGLGRPEPDPATRVRSLQDCHDLFEDIADQTNILAVNTAIKAGMDTGQSRALAVVADEIERLAERSSRTIRRLGRLLQSVSDDAAASGSGLRPRAGELAAALDGARAGSAALAQASLLLSGLDEWMRAGGFGDGCVGAGPPRMYHVATQGAGLEMHGVLIAVANLAEVAEELLAALSEFTLPPAGTIDGVRGWSHDNATCHPPVVGESGTRRPNR